jgi:hypothetical protein
MAKQSTLLRVVGGLVVAGAAGLAAYVVAIRPWHLRWGATEDEVQWPMPGDELVPDPKVKATHAITIHAPAAAVWPWLVQWGYQRGGFYSYDWIDRALGSEGVASVDRILAEHQHLEVGDPVLVAPDNGFTVAAIEPGRSLVLLGRYDMATGKPLALDDPLPENYLNCGWAWLLEKINEVTTRFVIRIRIDYNPSLANQVMYRAFVEPGSFVMERKMMLGVKERAEAALKTYLERGINYGPVPEPGV